MGPKVKKAPKNAFSFFLEDYVESLRLNGRYISYRIAAEECSPLWQQMSKEDKEKYSKIAVAAKQSYKDDKTKKFTSLGISYAQLEREQELLRLKTEEADTEIKMTISNLDSELLKMHLFYIIHCNYYCVTDKGIYVPGELAIVEFSLGDGIRRSYHTLIDPGHLPLGYAFESKQTIDEIHGLPYPPYDEGEKDYCGILSKVLDFLEPGMLPDGRYPPVYCTENNIKASENILNALSDSRGEGESHFRVFLLQKMFFWLKNKCVEYLDDENVGFPVMSNAESEISKDVFRYTRGISCIFHLNSEEKYHNCSLSVVQRLVYIICDHCCQYVDVKLIPGKHCGLKCDTKRDATRARLGKSQSFSSAPPTEVDYDGRSSYADNVSTIECKKEGAGSFLHEEFESSFGAFDVASVSSFASRNPFEVMSVGSTGRARGETSDADFSEAHRKLPIGRGGSLC